MLKKDQYYTLDECVVLYLKDRAARRLSDATIYSDKVSVGYFVEWLTANRISCVAEIDREVLENYRRDLFSYRKKDGEPLKASTQRTRLIAILSFLKHMDYLGVIDGSFLSRFELPKARRNLPKRIPDTKEVERIFSQSGLPRVC